MSKRGRAPKRVGGVLSESHAYVSGFSYDDSMVEKVEKKFIHGEWVDVKVCKPGYSTNPISISQKKGLGSSLTSNGDLYAPEPGSLFSKFPKNK